MPERKMLKAAGKKKKHKSPSKNTYQTSLIDAMETRKKRNVIFRVLEENNSRCICFLLTPRALVLFYFSWLYFILVSISFLLLCNKRPQPRDLPHSFITSQFLQVRGLGRQGMAVCLGSHKAAIKVQVTMALIWRLWGEIFFLAYSHLCGWQNSVFRGC